MRRTRLPGIVLPAEAKPEVGGLPGDAAAVRAIPGDGSYGGALARPDEDMLGVWAIGVEETREQIERLPSFRHPRRLAEEVHDGS